MTTRVVLVTLVAAAVGAGAAATEAVVARPNVLVILADDLGFSDPGSSGGEIDTPNLDRLAAGGLRFTQGYNTARCWPTRAALLTGYYPQAIGRDALPGGKGGAQGKRPRWAKLLPERLAASGYRSYHSGKWHVDGDPRAQGFARSLDVAGAGQNNYFDAGGVTDDGTPLAATPGFYATTAIGDHAVACLAEHTRDHAGTPFFHYVAFTAPHFPLQAPPDLVAKYRDRYRAGWDVVRAARCARVRELGMVTTTPAEPEPDVGPPYQPDAKTLARLGPGEIDRPRPWAGLTDEQREFQAAKMAVHAAMVEAMDREVGRIVAQLEAMRALDDTFIIFLSDNGASAEIMIRGEGHDPVAPVGSRKTFVCLGPGWSTVANAPFRRHKTWVHEGGIATPWIVHWPKGIPARGELRAQPVHAIDLVPTVLEIARVPEEQAQSAPPLQGRSFARALADPAAPPAHESLWWCHEGHRAVRAGDWKLVAANGGPWELYDLAADRCETSNLAAAHPDRVAALEREWNRIAEDCHEMVPAPAAANAPAAPNFVVILIDDLGYGDIGPFGATRQKTPNLDRMAAEGRRFTSFYAAPACSVSRAQLLTGCYGPRVGNPYVYFPAGREGLDPAEVTLAERLKSLGYATACIGKWHLGDQPEFLPTRQGFDRYLGIPYSNDMQKVAVATGERVVPLVRDETVAELLTDEAQRRIVERSTDEAVAFIRASKDRPFFLYLPHTAVHLPHFPAERFRGGSGNGAFGDWVEEMDWSVGRVLEALREHGLDEKTLVVFTSDNGPWIGPVKDATSAGPLRGSKGSTWEGGVRVPTIARWPGRIPAGTSCDSVAGTIDLVPTFVALAGGNVPAEPVIDGRDMSGLLFGTGVESPREAHYYFLGDQLQAVRQGRWKLAVAAQPLGMGRGQEKVPATLAAPRLYDLETDVGETTDVAAGHAAVVEQLRGLATRMAAELGDPVSPARRPPGRVDHPTMLYPVNETPQAAPPAATPARAASFNRRAAGAPPTCRPNVVLFLADDLGWGELGCYGNPEAVTPHLDRFASEGLRFIDCHSACPVCSPSRAALLTGRHPSRTGVFTWIPEGSPIHLPAGEIALPRLLREAGYDTCHVGKWHLNGQFNSPEQPQPDDHGYDWWLATQNNAAPSHAFPENFVRNGAVIGRADDHSALFIAKEAVTWLEERRDPAKPFFLAVWTHEPHYPIASADRYEKLHGRIDDPAVRTYRANVTQLDDAFGTVMKALDAMGVAGDTLVFFTSDNGPEGDGVEGPGRGLAGDLKGRKRAVHEGGHRVPGIVRWPGRIEPGTVSDLPVIGSDFFPTVLAAAGLEPPAGVTLDGVNLLPAFAGGAVERPVPMCWRWRGQVAWREGDWKLVTNDRFDRPELYDLAIDRGETHDLAAGEPGRVAEMLGHLQAYLAEIEAGGSVWWRTEPDDGPRRRKSPQPATP